MSKNFRKRPHRNIPAKQLFFQEMATYLPVGFCGFFKIYDGLISKIGKNTFIDIWKVEDILSRNTGVQTNKSRESFIIFCEVNEKKNYAFGRTNKGIFDVTLESSGTYDFIYFADGFVNFFLKLFDLDQLNT